tara:strand:- start:1258 stop:2247 length:990 start_codon:yes stop_codon:yes gene_type:complete
MKGFDRQFKDLPDFILKITYQIWENNDVESIRKYYADVPEVSLATPTRSPSGVIYGAEPVIEATLASKKLFPDRTLLGEDVIWIGNDDEGYFSSHRILSTATHNKDGLYGKATGKKLVYRGIADCACKKNQVYDEWLVRDQGAIVRQIGIDPKVFAYNLIMEEGGIDKAKQPFNNSTPIKSIYNPPRLPESNTGKTYGKILTKIMNGEKDVVEENYDRAIQQYQPGGFIKYGTDEVISFWNNLKSCFPNSRFNIEHISFKDNNNELKKAAIRWSLSGKHSGAGIFGSPSGANVYVMGINHAEFGSRGIKSEWVLYDETMIWKQILIQTG